MVARYQLPGMRWFLWLRNVALRVGVLTGIYVACAFIIWQLIDYLIPQLDRFAGVRDFAGSALLIALLTIPVFRFHNEPAKLFLSGLAAWTLLTLTYVAADMIYPLVETQMSVVQIFTIGAFSYGLVAVFHWVFLLCMEARHRHIAQAQQASPGSRSRTR